jgi:DNA helicase IV
VSSFAEAPAPETGDLQAEQRYLDTAYLHLEAMAQRTTAAAEDAAQRAKADWNAAVAHGHLMDRLASITDDRRPLCFGRIDEEASRSQLVTSWYIGRRHVEDGGGRPVVVDWRAPVAVPFYRATYQDPFGLECRRRFILDGRSILDLLDERFDDPEAGALAAAAAGLPDPLLAELGRARSGPMRDIVATIAAEQDLIIRSPLQVPLVVQGGPGTGKTAVGLHRAAFLLYEHRDLLLRQGVLVLGPNKRFLAYISEVLPSLGEVAVVQTTLTGLVPSVPVRADEDALTARIKGDARLAEVIARAAVDGVGPPPGPLAANTRWGTVHLPPQAVEDIINTALDSGGAAGQRRTRFRRAVIRHVAAELSERRRPAVVSAEETSVDLRSDRPFQAGLERAWPNRTAAALIRSLLGRGPLLARAAAGLLDPSEAGCLRRRTGRTVAEEPWTEADIALVDEAEAVIGGTARRYGHIVVDEAQDLSPMAWRMVARRSIDGRSLTVLGDLAQATSPGALKDWDSVIHALGRPPGATVAGLSVGYRVPRPVMEFANRLLPAVAADLTPTDSVRPWGEPPLLIPVADRAALLATSLARIRELAALHQSAAVIAPPAMVGDLLAELGEGPNAAATVLGPAEAKGLEFDAVVVVEPAAIIEMNGGPGLLYIALTRAVQELSVTHSRPLPDLLTATA